jgi:rhodanese-related sulfurtransferase
MNTDYITLTRGQLQTALGAGPPENHKRDEGYALVNVLDREEFQREHIPGSISIPRQQLDEFEKHFDREKKIIVYCASPDCSASNEAAEALARRGFRHVFDYAGGMRDWKQAGNPVEGTAG